MLLTSCFQGYSFQLAFQIYSFSRVHLAFTLSGILTRISLGFSDISSDIPVSSPWAHESTSLDVNEANGMLYGNAKRIFCYNVTCLPTKKKARVGVILQGASSAPHFLLARMQRYSFQLVFQLYCLSRVHLAFTLSASCRLFSRNYVRTRMNFFRAQAGVICQGASSAPHLLLARLQRYSFQLVFLLYENNLPTSPLRGCCFQLAFQTVLPAYTLQLPSNCIKKFCSNKRGILTGISLGFSDISSDISSLWAHEGTSLDVNKANGMLYSNAKRIFCYNVTCFATNKCCSSRSHLSGCFKCSSLLACKAAKVQLSICFPIM